MNRIPIDDEYAAHIARTIQEHMRVYGGACKPYPKAELLIAAIKEASVPQPWDNEDDLYEFESHGFNCEVRRHEFGHLCGYIYLTEDHPFRDGVPEDFAVDVHGGVTYESAKKIGFDGAHGGDVTPNFPTRSGTYRHAEFMIAETKGLARQLQVWVVRVTPPFGSEKIAKLFPYTCYWTGNQYAIRVVAWSEEEARRVVEEFFDVEDVWVGHE